MTPNTQLPPFLFLDLDDTIVAYTDSGKQCWQKVVQEFAPQLDLSPETFLTGLNRTSNEYWSDPERHRIGRQDLRGSRRVVLGLTFEHLGLPASPLSSQIADAFTDMREEMFYLFEGAVPALEAFKQQGIRLAMLTNGNAVRQRAKIEKFKLAAYFDLIIIESEFGIGKPDHRVFLHALETMGATPGITWMVGDDLMRDLQPADQLGMQTVWIDCEKSGLPPDRPVTPTHSLHSLAELIL